VEERTEPHLESLRRSLYDREDVLVEGLPLPRAPRVEADRRRELWDDRGEHAGVAREAERLGGPRAEQQLRQLAHAVRLEPAADPLGRDEPHVRPLLYQLARSLVVRRKVELRHEPKPAQ